MEYARFLPPQYAPHFKAVPIFARNVARGWTTIEEARTALLGITGEPPTIPRSLAHTYLIWALNDAVSAAEIARTKAADAVAKVIAPLLDAQAPVRDIRLAGRNANPDRLLTADEMETIVATETAWWIRLHAVMTEVQHAA